MLKIRYTNQFKKDFKLAIKRGLNVGLLETIIELLANNKQLEPANNDHFLNGNYKGFKECHIQPDWLLIYHIDKELLTLTLVRNGTHSDLF